jgi:hypothetical protein
MFLTSAINIKWETHISTYILINFQYFIIYVYLCTNTNLLPYNTHNGHKLRRYFWEVYTNIFTFIDAF